MTLFQLGLARPLDSERGVGASKGLAGLSDGKSSPSVAAGRKAQNLRGSRGSGAPGLGRRSGGGPDAAAPLGPEGQSEREVTS